MVTPGIFAAGDHSFPVLVNFVIFQIDFRIVSLGEDINPIIDTIFVALVFLVLLHFNDSCSPAKKQTKQNDLGNRDFVF